MKSQKYLAITIGPLVDTMLKAKSLRELWSASFTFSKLLGCLIDSFEPLSEKLLSPSKRSAEPLYGAGVYPDRCFFLMKRELSAVEIKNAKDEALALFVKLTGIQHNGYYQIYIVQETIDKHPIGKLNKELDSLELFKKYSPKSKIDFGNQYWNHGGVEGKRGRTKQFFQKLYEKAYLGKYEGRILPTIQIVNNDDFEVISRFKSVPEIASIELESTDYQKYWDVLGYHAIETNNEDKPYFSALKLTRDGDSLEEEKMADVDFMPEIKKAFSDEFKSRHKYYAIVHADGDNVGQLIRELEEQKGDIGVLSNALNEFVTKAGDLLVSYDAFPIYMGGDDLLFFTPVSNSKKGKSLAHGNISDGDNLFFLMSRINQLFKDIMTENEDKILGKHTSKAVMGELSLSFGVALTYHKHPMSEAIKESFEQLKYNAKHQKGKNFISTKWQKHSGQPIYLGFNQSSSAFKTFLELSNTASEEKFLNSVMFKLRDQIEIIKNISQDTSRLQHYFDKNFDEQEHKAYKDFFVKLTKFIKDLMHPESGREVSSDNALKTVFGALKFIQFLNAKDHD